MAVIVGGAVVLGGAIITAGVLGLLVVSLASAAMNSIVLAALYLYAATNTAPAAFDAALLSDAFAKK